MTYRTIDVLNAAEKTFLTYGDSNYAVPKTNSFMRRCGYDGERVDIYISGERIREVIYAMLDRDSEKVFWDYLRGDRQ